MSSTRISRIVHKATLRTKLAWQALTQFDDDPGRSLFQPSFSQCGEDMIAKFLLKSLGISRPTYLDIGAHHPTRLSNSALFYLLGGRGMNIEPDPQLFREFVRQRPQDINLNIGIGTVPGEMRFFRMADPSLNTFSEEEAARMADQEGIPIKEQITLPVRNVAQVLREYNFCPNFVSVDVEGKDLEVLKDFEFDRHRPEVFCVETVSFSLTQAGTKSSAIADYMAQQGYGVYADTYINTLYVDRARFAGAKES